MTTTDTEATSSPWCDENDTPIAVGDWVLVDDARGNPTIQRVAALVVDGLGPHLRLHNDDDPPPGHVIRLDPFPADADEPDWFRDQIGGRWIGPVGDGTILAQLYDDEMALLLAAVRQAADFPVARVELFTDTTGDHHWRAIHSELGDLIGKESA